MADIVETPLTVVEAQVTVPLFQHAPLILREEGPGVAVDAKIGQLTTLLPEHALSTDFLNVTRPGLWNRKMPISTLLNMIVLPDQGEATLDPANEGGNTVHLNDFPAYVTSNNTVETLNIWMPPATRHGQEAEVYFAARINNVVMRVQGTDSPDGGQTYIAVTKSTKGLPLFVEAGSTLKFRYNRHEADQTTWDDCQWHVAGYWNVEVERGATNLSREYGIPMDGGTLNTTKVQAAADAAKIAGAPQGGFTYGQGRRFLYDAGVSKQGAVNLSRILSVEGMAGTLNASIVRCDYDDRAGVVGEDAAFKMLDDGFQQASLVGQQAFRNLGIDGKYGNEPGHGVYDGNRHELNHKRHGIWYDVVVDGNTDRACSLYDVHISNMPGSGWKVVGNDQVHGADFKLLNNEFGIDFTNVSDGKLRNFGLGGNRRGNRATDCASLKQSGVDAWCDSHYYGKAGIDFLWQFVSCSKCTATEGEWEGPVLYTGDNHKSYGNGNDGSVTDSKAAFQISQNKQVDINQKVSTDYYLGTESVRPYAHVMIKDTDLEVRGCSWGYKLGTSPSQLELDATPRFIFGFDTQMDPGNPNYAQALRNCGEVSLVGGNLYWHYPKRQANGNLAANPKPIVACLEHVADKPWKLRGIEIGRPYLGVAGQLRDDEIEMNGQTLTSDVEPLLYLFTSDATTPNDSWQRKLTDADSGGSVQYRTFTLANMNALMPPPTGFTWRCKRYQ